MYPNLEEMTFKKHYIYIFVFLSFSQISDYVVTEYSKGLTALVCMSGRRV